LAKYLIAAPAIICFILGGLVSCFVVKSFNATCHFKQSDRPYDRHQNGLKLKEPAASIRDAAVLQKAKIRMTGG
jgi:hypothetical protein